MAGLAALTFAGGCVVIENDHIHLHSGSGPNAEGEDRRVDWLGAILVSAGLILITFALGQGQLAPTQWRTPCTFKFSSLYFSSFPNHSKPPKHRHTIPPHPRHPPPPRLRHLATPPRKTHKHKHKHKHNPPPTTHETQPLDARKREIRSRADDRVFGVGVLYILGILGARESCFFFSSR